MQEWKWHKQLLLTLLKHIILYRESVAQKKNFPSYLQTNALSLLSSNKCSYYIPRLSVNKTNTVIGWFLVMCPWSNSNVSWLGKNCAVVAHVPSSTACFCHLFKRKYKIYNKALNIRSLGKLVSFCFAWCFPQLPLGKHQDFFKNKTKCFPQYYTLSVCCLWGE